MLKAISANKGQCKGILTLTHFDRGTVKSSCFGDLRPTAWVEDIRF